STDDREILWKELGWYGDLAIAPPETPNPRDRAAAINPARRTAIAFLVLVIVMIMLGVLGFFLLVLWFVFVLMGRVRLRMRAEPLFGSIYAETFALWMLLFVGLGYGLSRIPAGSSQLLLSEIGAFLSLTALAWPLFRGVPAWRLRDDIGF